MRKSKAIRQDYYIGSKKTYYIGQTLKVRAPSGIGQTLKLPTPTHTPAPSREHVKANTSPSGHLVAKSIFVWMNMDGQCGLSEYVKHLSSAAEDSKYCKNISEILYAENVLIQVIPGLTLVTAEDIRNLRTRGIRVTLDFHHYDDSWKRQVECANASIVHHPSIANRYCRYLPLLVPVLPREEAKQIGGIVHFGIGGPPQAAGKRLDIGAMVARELDTKFYCYGVHNRQAVPTDLLQYTHLHERYENDVTLARLLRQHSCGLMGRRGELRSQSTASVRFMIGAGVPTVIDQTWSHEDLKGVLDIVPFDDLKQTTERVKLIMTNENYRSEALARADAYAHRNSPKNICAEMGIEVKR